MTISLIEKARLHLSEISLQSEYSVKGAHYARCRGIVSLNAPRF
jgi:hypothetical protein